MSVSKKMLRALPVIAMLVAIPALSAIPHGTAPIGKIPQPTGKIDTGKVLRYVFPVTLQALKKTGVAAKDTWGTTTSSNNSGNYPPGYPIESDYNGAFRLRYFMPGQTAPGTAAITIESSESKNFAIIHSTVTSTPVDGVIKSSPAALDLYVVKGREYTGQTKTWFLRARQGDKISNNVTVTVADLIH